MRMPRHNIRMAALDFALRAAPHGPNVTDLLSRAKAIEDYIVGVAKAAPLRKRKRSRRGG